MSSINAAEIVTSTLVLKLERVWEDGGAAYRVDGIRGTVYVKAGFFGKSGPPATLSLEGLGLSTPVVKEVKEVKAKKVAPVLTPFNPEEYNPEIEAFVAAQAEAV